MIALEQEPGAHLVRPPVAPAHDTSSTTVRQRDPPGAGSSTSATTASSPREKRKWVGSSSEWKPSRSSTASSNPPTPILARATIPASTRPTQDLSSSDGGTLRYAYSPWDHPAVKASPPRRPPCPPVARSPRRSAP